jgi:hypothetical protein
MPLIAGPGSSSTASLALAVSFWPRMLQCAQKPGFWEKPGFLK